MENTDKVRKSWSNPLFYLFSKTWQYSEGNRHNIVSYWLMFIIANTFVLICHPLLLAKIMDTLQTEGVHRNNLMFICGLLSLILAIDLFFWIFHGPARVIENLNGFIAKANYRKRLVRGVMALPLEWHSDHHSGDTIDKIEKGTGALNSFSKESFLVIAPAVQFLVSYSMLTYFSPSAGIIVLIMIAISIWVIARFDKVLIEEYKELNHIENNISASILDRISNITTVVILRVERSVFQAISHSIDKPYSLFKKNVIRNEAKWCIISLCNTITTILVLMFYFFQHAHSIQGILIGNVYLLFRYLEKMEDLSFRFCGMYGDILLYKAKVMNSEEVTADFKESSFTNHVLPKDWKIIRVNNLNFSYQGEDRTELHLEDISITIKRGERIAFVGASGSGKTTMLKVMRDLYTPHRFSLEVDGIIVSQGFEGIARDIALVPQDPEIFATSIKENITLGAEYSSETIRKFTDMACFTDVAEALPRKLESMIREKGVNLSGGQRQRLALSRGLLACEDKSLVLLDEPTSSVDVSNERLIYQNIFASLTDKSIISSIHRLHLLPMFHRIYMFEKGRIIGQGTFDDLLFSCTEFQELWKKYRDCDSLLS